MKHHTSNGRAHRDAREIFNGLGYLVSGDWHGALVNVWHATFAPFDADESGLGLSTDEAARVATAASRAAQAEYLRIRRGAALRRERRRAFTEPHGFGGSGVRSLERAG